MPGAHDTCFSSVTKYSSSTGRVHLQHAYPTPSPGKEAVTVSAVVDVNLLIETLKSTDTQTGEWVNVIGYVGDKNSTGTRTARTEPGSKEVQVQALMVWSAGALRIEEYEKAVQGRKTSGGVT
ncbi:hypothetical protein MMC19_006489 [Ptychographa xylographoides]|nr:hypothetical protein [Ptychographa xylographoides]